jgi:serine/threonine-protein kinase HipA
MTINGKRDGFLIGDIRAAGKSAGLKQGRAVALLEEVTAAVARWPEFAGAAALGGEVAERIAKVHRRSTCLR